MPTPEQFARLSVLETANKLKSDPYQIRVREDEDFFEVVAQYRAAMGVTLFHSVMVIPPPISAEAWEAQAIRTQQRLASGSDSDAGPISGPLLPK